MRLDPDTTMFYRIFLCQKKVVSESSILWSDLIRIHENFYLRAVLRISNAYPGSRIRIRIKEFKYFNPKKIVSKLSEILSGMFIPDPDTESGSWFYSPIPDPGVNKAPDAESGSATLLARVSFLTWRSKTLKKPHNLNCSPQWQSPEGRHTVPRPGTWGTCPRARGWRAPPSWTWASAPPGSASWRGSPSCWNPRPSPPAPGRIGTSPVMGGLGLKPSSLLFERILVVFRICFCMDPQPDPD